MEWGSGFEVHLLLYTDYIVVYTLYIT